MLEETKWNALSSFYSYFSTGKESRTPALVFSFVRKRSWTLNCYYVFNPAATARTLVNLECALHLPVCVRDLEQFAYIMFYMYKIQNARINRHYAHSLFYYLSNTLFLIDTYIKK